MKVHSLTEGNYISGNPCGNKTRIMVFDLRISGFVEMGERLCSDKDEVSVVTESNMGIVRSHVKGSFFVRVKSLPKRSPTFDNFGIVGMEPPFEGSADFFRLSEPVHGDFRPSLGVPGYAPLSSSYGPPSHRPFPYPGKPGQIVDITSPKPEAGKINSTTLTTVATSAMTTPVNVTLRPNSTESTNATLSTTTTPKTTVEEF
ncbi:uncharacterized protein LOC112127756 isoform X2 [Cimex lectularius]|nr:uncharacterized protein LOC112127756 isoform X2 [Cimex lectularius]